MRKIGYRFYPFVLLGFFRVANQGAINLAIPIYYNQIGVAPVFIGIITSAFMFTYMFAPLLFKNFSDKYGIKNSLLISIGGTLLLQIVFQFTLNPLIFTILRLMEGLLLGLFWPVMSSALSKISPDVKNELKTTVKDKLMKYYGLSWNIGAISGFLLGAFVLFFIQDILVIFDLTLLFIIIAFIASIMFEEPIQKNINEKIREDYSEVEEVPSSSIQEVNTLPLFIPLLIIGLYGFVQNGNGLIFPLKAEILGYEIYTNYLLSFISMTFQTVFTYIALERRISKLKTVTIYVLILFGILFVLMSINANLLVFVFLFAGFGTFSAIIYSFAFKYVILRNTLENTSKFGTYFETTIGFNFFMGPIIAGFFAEFNVNISYIFLMILVVLVLFVFLYSIKQYQDR